MAHVKYKGDYDARTLRALDLKTLGAVSEEDFNTAKEAGTLPPDLTWKRGGTLELPDALADFLVEKLAEEFEIVDEADLPKPIISLADLAAQDGQSVEGVEEIPGLSPEEQIASHPEAGRLIEHQADSIDGGIDGDSPQEGEGESDVDDD